MTVNEIINPDEIVLDGMGLLIPPGGKCRITSRRRPEQAPLRCQRFVVPIEMAEHFRVIDLRIGNYSVFAGFVGWPNGIPASRNIDFELENSRLVHFAMDVTIEVRNTSDQPRMFCATIHGKVL